MCRVLTFHHLCGHVHSTRNLSCRSPVPFTSPAPACHAPPAPTSESKILSPFLSCAKTIHEPLLYPTLCKTCEEIGVISDYLAKTPGARMKAVMEWREKNSGHAIGARASTTQVIGATRPPGNRNSAPDLEESLKDMPFLTPDDLQASSSISAERGRSNSNVSTATTIIHIDAQSSPCSSQLSLSPTATANAAKPRTTLSSTSPPSPGKGCDPISPREDRRLTSSISETFQRTRALVSRMTALNAKMKARLPVQATPFIPPPPATSITAAGEGEGREGLQNSRLPILSDAAQRTSISTETEERGAPSGMVEPVRARPSTSVSTSTIRMERRGAISGPSGSSPAEHDEDRGEKGWSDLI